MNATKKRRQNIISSHRQTKYNVHQERQKHKQQHHTNLGQEGRLRLTSHSVQFTPLFLFSFIFFVFYRILLLFLFHSVSLSSSLPVFLICPRAHPRNDPRLRHFVLVPMCLYQCTQVPTFHVPMYSVLSVLCECTASSTTDGPLAVNRRLLFAAVDRFCLSRDLAPLVFTTISDWGE